jgi:hypothetical protein
MKKPKKHPPEICADMVRRFNEIVPPGTKIRVRGIPMPFGFLGTVDRPAFSANGVPVVFATRFPEWVFPIETVHFIPELEAPQ